jgi:hypothetical protein
MRITEVFHSKAIASHWTEAASNRLAYVGAGLFPNKKKMGLDLKWIKGHKGLPVSLAPSNFDAKSTLRSREGFQIDETEMPFFRESMLVKERDEQEIMRVQSAEDPYAQDVLSRLFDDAATLMDGAEVVAERMRMQLLAPQNEGHPGIHISAKGQTYTFDYDKDGSYAANNYLALTEATDQWSDHENSDPMADIEHGQDAVEALTGVRPSIVMMSRKTLAHVKANAKVKNYILAQNATANVIITDARVKELFQTELGVSILVYAKQYKDEEGKIHQFYPDGYATLLPSGALGSTWRGVTPEERTLAAHPETADVSVTADGVAIAVVVTEDPVNTKTTVSEIVLPSYERMDETYVIKAYENA